MVVKTSTARRTKEARRLLAEDWIAAALDTLAVSGVDAVRVESLARDLSVTKGSFYWHFADRSALLSAMLGSWRRRATLAIIERLERTEESPRDRLRGLIRLPFASSRSAKGANLELAIRLWAKRDAAAAAAVEEVDQQRLAYLVSLLRQLGLADEEARMRAYVTYAYIIAEGLVSRPDSAGLAETCERWLIGA